MITKKLIYLNALSMLAVICNHAAGMGLTAMFWWAHRYRPVTSPNFDQINSLPYYALVLEKQLTVFCVPAFLFTSGLFISFAARGEKSTLNWKMIQSRLKCMLVPYLLWSVLFFAYDFVEGNTYTLPTYLYKVVLSGATPIYWYIPVLCQFYLLAPFLVVQVKTRWKRVLVLSLVVQILSIAYNYLHIFLGWIDLTWFFGNYVFYFSLGIAFGFQGSTILKGLRPFQWPLLGGLLIAAVVSTIEGLYMSGTSGRNILGVAASFGALLYSLIFIIVFLVWERFQPRKLKLIDTINQRMFGIYLAHPLFLISTAKLVYHFLPRLLGYQSLLQPLLILCSLGGPLALMEIVSRFTQRKYYRLVFG